MSKVKIITDSCSDLTVGQLEKYNIDYAKMTTVYNDTESEALLDWTADDVREFYDIMRVGDRITTAQVSVEEFKRVFGRYLSEGYDIVYIGCSSKQSGSVNTAFVTARAIKSEYPDRDIFCIDSLNASIGEGMLAIEAAKMAADGMGAEEIKNRIVEIRKKVNQFVTVHSLDALRRAGRVKGAAAFFGNIMGIKPIIISDVNGDQAPIKKVKGRENSLKTIVQLLKNSIIAPEEQTVYITHADCESQEVNALIELIRNEIPCKGVEVGYIGPIIGASIGPDAVGIWCFGAPVTYSVSE